MTDWFKDTLRTLGLWLAGLGGWVPPPPEVQIQVVTQPCQRAHVPGSDLTALAMRLVSEHQAQMPAASGEAKRHQVLARLKKAAPDARERECAMAIELAVNKVLP